MGAVLSGTFAVDRNNLQLGLGELPESCMAEVLVYLDPSEICGAARLNRAFRRAATADLVWESKLPENYVYLLEKSEEKGGGGGKKMTKKEIYARLSQPNPFHGDTKVFWIDRCSGGICMSISSKTLHITGIHDRRYWKYIPSEESRFQTVAYLQQIWWVEVVGEMDFCFPAGIYSVFFKLHLGRMGKRLGRRVCNSEHIHGWEIKPVRFQVSTSCGQKDLKRSYLDEPGKWKYYHGGDFVVDDSNVPTRVMFSLIQIDCTHTKGGLCVDSVLIYPSGVEPDKVVTAFQN